MSITFDPQNKEFKINEIVFKSNNYEIIDYYDIVIKDIKDAKLLEILDEKTENKNGSIIAKDRYGYCKEIKYINNEKVKNEYFCDVEYLYYASLQNDLDKICIEIYKKIIEKSVLIRANKVPNIDYLHNIYIIMNNNLCENISKKFDEIFGNLINCSNLRIHFMNVNVESNYYNYTKSCSVC